MVPRGPEVQPPDRGPLLSPTVVFERYFRAGWPDVKDPGRWVRRHLPEVIQRKVSKREVGIFARDVEEHIASLGRESWISAK